MTGPEYSDAAMVERAVRNAIPHGTLPAQRWVAVREVFGYGSTTSVALCRRFGLDPYEELSGTACDSCGYNGAREDEDEDEVREEP